MDAQIANLQNRKNIWKIDYYSFCPVIGTCLTIEEQKRILKKLKISFKQLRPYEIHKILVQSIQVESQLSRRVNNYLNQKYSHEIATFNNFTEQEFLISWREKMTTGDICGLFWVAVTRQDLSEKAMEIISGDVHMLSHISGHEIRKELYETDMLRKQNQKLSNKLKEEIKLRRRFKKELDQSVTLCFSAESKVKSIEKEKNAVAEKLQVLHIDEIEAANMQLQFQLAKAQSELQEALSTVKSLRQENESLFSKLSAQEKINRYLKDEAEKVLYQVADKCNEGCPAFDLCARRILIVGGISKLKKFYQDMIEKMGGVFEYHDGGNGSRLTDDILQGLVSRADVVLCPVNVNSHRACLSIKRICKTHHKPYYMLASSSLSSISEALASLASIAQQN